MALEKFIPQSPDRFIRNSKDFEVARFGHLNEMIDYINNYVLPDGLQLAGSGPMSTTLRAITDNLGNASKLSLSTDTTAISADLKFMGATSGYVGIQAPNTVTTYNLKLPTTTGTPGQALVTDGTGQLSFATVATPPGGVDGSIQYNGAGALAGNSDFTWNNTLKSFKGGVNNTATGVFSNVLGGCGNKTLSSFSLIGSGLNNCSTDIYGTVVNGIDNYAIGCHNFIGGGFKNCTYKSYSTIVNGACNIVCTSAPFSLSTVSGGYLNHICGGGALNFIGSGISNKIFEGACNVVVGGESNTISATSGNGSNFIGGGRFNSIGTNGFKNVIVGGTNNRVCCGVESFIGGGAFNCITSTSGAGSILGGDFNVISGNYSTLGGGWQNNISAECGFIGGGKFNINAGELSTITGGCCNTTSGRWSTISGGQCNIVTNDNTFVGGGELNKVYCFNGVISGGSVNTNCGCSSTIGGGRQNSIANNADFSTLGGGLSNTISSINSTIAGGNSNSVSSNNSTIGGGQSNILSTGSDSTIVGGSGNCLTGQYSVIGGRANVVSSGRAAVFGFQNNVSGIGNFATGSLNIVSSSYSSTSGLLTTNYLYGSRTQGSFGFGSSSGNAQTSTVVASKEGTLTTAGTTVLSLDGTGTTNLIIPSGSNRMWKVKVEYVGTITTITGTATGLAVGNSVYGESNFGFKRVGGTSSMGTMISDAQSSDNAIMDTCVLAYTAGGSGELALTFTAPTFAGGGSVTMRVVAKVSLVEVAY